MTRIDPEVLAKTSTTKIHNRSKWIPEGLGETMAIMVMAMTMVIPAVDKITTRELLRGAPLIQTLIAEQIILMREGVIHLVMHHLTVAPKVNLCGIATMMTAPYPAKTVTHDTDRLSLMVPTHLHHLGTKVFHQPIKIIPTMQAYRDPQQLCSMKE